MSLLSFSGISEILGLSLPPTPFLYASLLLVVALPLLVLYQSRRLPLEMSVLALAVLLIFAYLAYLGYKVAKIILPVQEE
jgi:hypothetical protein